MDWEEKVKQWIADDDVHKFYVSSRWRRLRRKVLESDRFECQACKASGKYTRATHVHHVKHLRDRPDLSVSPLYMEGGREHRQLMSLCFSCHEAEHPERQTELKEKDPPLTLERWD